MRRSLALLLGLGLPLTWAAPPAGASGAALCAISGTINFAPSPSVPTEGTWDIGPAVINCHGIFRSYERFTGPGSFSGYGTYTDLPGTPGGCLHQIGSGTVDYRLQTAGNDLHIEEQHDFVLAGAGGAFTTPSLSGAFQVAPPYDGDCVTTPVSGATFAAQGTFIRVNSTGVEP